MGCELVAMACELLAWMQLLALDRPARAWEPKRLRLRLFSAAGRIVRGGRRLRLRIAATWPWAAQLTAAIGKLQAFAPADPRQTTPATRKGNPRACGTPPTPRDSRAARHAQPLKTAKTATSAGQFKITKD
jgi:Transposase DDE domain group 1